MRDAARELFVGMQADLVDLLYEAAFVPDLWSSALERMAKLSNSVGTAIFLFSDNKPTRGRALDGQREQLRAFLSSDTLPFSASVQNVCRAQPSSFVDFDGLMTSEEKERDIALKHYQAMGIGAHLGTSVPMPDGDLTILVQQRLTKDGAYTAEEIELLNHLRPHFARASLVAARLGLEQALNAVNTMAAMGYPAAVLSGSGHVRATNSLFDDLESVYATAAFGGLVIVDSVANTLFQQAVLAMRDHDEPLVSSFPLAPLEGRPPLIIHLLPLRRAAHDLFADGESIVVVTAVGSSSLVPRPSILTSLFDLAPAEAKLAAALASGLSLKAAALKQDIQVSTARYYLDKIFQKTGTHQQSELVALLKSAQPAGSGRAS